MPVTLKIHQNSRLTQAKLKSAIANFKNEGELIGRGYRNVIKIIDIDGELYNIKAFKTPNLINKIVYRFFRKSKAERSYLYADKLLKLSILTPKPEAYAEYTSLFVFGKSYYISKQLSYDFTIRKLIDEPQCDDYDIILRQFTQFTFNLHEKGIHFLDHSPGNTLIRKVGNMYEFYLVDLNRMKFHEMSFDARMKNFAKLSPKDNMLEVMSDEYAKLYTKKSKAEITEVMYAHSEKFSSNYRKKEVFKRRYYFWRKKG